MLLWPRIGWEADPLRTIASAQSFQPLESKVPCTPVQSCTALSASRQEGGPAMAQAGQAWQQHAQPDYYQQVRASLLKSSSSARLRPVQK